MSLSYFLRSNFAINYVRFYCMNCFIIVLLSMLNIAKIILTRVLKVNLTACIEFQIDNNRTIFNNR